MFVISNKKVVLIVDDEPDLVELMKEEFSSYPPYSVRVAYSGKEAAEILAKEKIDIIISDFKMPNGNGLYLLEKVNQINPKPIFFFVSGQADITTDDAIKAGAHRFFSKPFDLDELVHAVDKDLESAK
jgi:DNA-binding NtrC family response regulator